MKQTNKLKMIAAMALSITVAYFTASCSNDEFFGFDNESHNMEDLSELINQNNLDLSDYLTVSSFNPEEWSDSDYIAFSAATERMGVSYSETKKQYEFKVSNGKDINVSDTLYSMVVNLFGHTNMIMSSHDIKNKRIKNNNREIWWGLPDCGPAAVSHMGLYAPSYSDAISKCNEMFPNWIQNGGIPRDSLGVYIREFVFVARYHDMSFCSSPITTLRNVVMFYFIQYPYGHIVNVYKYTKCGSYKLLYYHDFSSTSQGNGTLLESQMSDIYPFPLSYY